MSILSMIDSRPLVNATAPPVHVARLPAAPLSILRKIGAATLIALFVGACESPAPAGIQAARTAVAARIASETPGDYYIGRRYFKPDFKFWGYIRKPGQPWSSAKLVMLNESNKLAPDREKLDFGSDNGYEYKLTGDFTGQTVYEPASNGFYPEFLVRSFELISTNPPPIFKSQMSGTAKTQTTRFTIEKPEPSF